RTFRATFPTSSAARSGRRDHKLARRPRTEEVGFSRDFDRYSDVLHPMMANLDPAVANKPIDIRALSRFLFDIGSHHDELIQASRRNETLCHYTSLEGALGIIGGNDLWLTNARFSNDGEEMDYGQKLILKVLEEMKPVDPSKIGLLDGVRKRMEESKREQVYI